MVLDRPHNPPDPAALSDTAEQEAERRRLRRLQVMVGMIHSVLAQDPELTPVKARALIAGCKQAALAMFPGKELAFDLIYKPRLERVLRERFPSP